MRLLVTTALAALCAIPAIADETTGTVVAFDRMAKVLVLEDRTVWSLPGSLTLPDDLVAGDKVMIDFESAGENGIATVNTLTRVAAN